MHSDSLISNSNFQENNIHNTFSKLKIKIIKKVQLLEIEVLILQITFVNGQDLNLITVNFRLKNNKKNFLQAIINHITTKIPPKMKFIKCIEKQINTHWYLIASGECGD